MENTSLKNMGISVIIPTRNRVELLKRAIDSIIEQTYTRIEIVIVDDGSEQQQKTLLNEMLSKVSEIEITLLSLPHRKNGHGPSFSRNTGVYAARFDYIAFLDDDDELIEPSYFESITGKLAASNFAADLILSNQIAIEPTGALHTDNIWLEKYFINGPYLKLNKEDVAPLSSVFFDDVLEFAHINTIIVKKDLFQTVGGFDEAIRYEEDRDLFYRLINQAHCIWATGITNAKHYIPKQRVSASSIEIIEKLRLQAIVFSKSINYTSNPRHLKLRIRQLQFTYIKFAEYFVAHKKYSQAIIYSKLATSLQFSLKWCCYTQYLKLKELTHSGKAD